MHGIKRVKKQKKLAVGVVAAVLAGLVAYNLLLSGFEETQNNQTNSEPKPAVQKEAPKPEPTPDPVSLQPELDAWLKSQPGTYSVVMRDLTSGKIIARHNPNERYFMASLYKLYVAYLALLDAQNGKHKLNEIYLDSWSRKDCIDKMIRISHSPCGEKYMAELNRQNIEDRLTKYGLEDTDYGSFVTSAADSELILKKLHEGQQLKDKYSQILLGAMRGQIYRDSIYKGAPAEAEVANKVGFRGYVEYHDAAIITVPEGSSYTLVILTKNATAERIADLTRTLLGALPS